MKIEFLNNLVALKDLLIFNTKANWIVIHRKKVFLFNQSFDELFYGLENERFDKEFVEGHLKFLINAENKEPVCSYVDYEFDEDLKWIIADGEKVYLP